MAWNHWTFKNAQYPVDTVDIWRFLICRGTEKDVKARPLPSRHKRTLCVGWLSGWAWLASLPSKLVCLSLLL